MTKCEGFPDQTFSHEKCLPSVWTCDLIFYQPWLLVRHENLLRHTQKFKTAGKISNKNNLNSK